MYIYICVCVCVCVCVIRSYVYPSTRMISLLLHETKVEPRSSVITMISTEYMGYNWLTYVSYTVEIGNYIITSCLLNNALVIFIVWWIEKGTGEPSKDSIWICHSPCAVEHNLCGKMVRMWQAKAMTWILVLVRDYLIHGRQPHK